MRIALLLDKPEHLASLLDVTRAMDHPTRAFGNQRDLARGLANEHFDLMVLGAPSARARYGAEVTPSLVRSIQQVPVLQLVEDSQQEWLMSLDEAPDDFMVWPLRPTELRARMQALMRRRQAVRDNVPVRHYGCYAVDTVARTVYLDGTDTALRPREFELACFLFRNLGRLMSRQHLLLTVWHVAAAIETRSVDTHMWRLRAALQLHGSHGYKLDSVYNRGYRLDVCEHAPLELAA